MSGHNKWSKVKHKKAVTDAKKSKEFGRLVQQLKIEAKKANGNVESSGLRAVIDQAKSANMPKENIDRAIANATGSGAASLEEVTYEAYGPGGTAIIIETTTDNRNRTAAEIKHLLSKQGLELANPGSATWAFTKNDGVWEATQKVELAEEDGNKLSTVIGSLEEQEDVEGVFTNT